MSDATETLQYSAQDALIVFTPSGKRGRFPVGTPVLSAARALGVDIDSVCGGRGLCGRCQVICPTGSFPKHGIHVHEHHLPDKTATEQRFEKVKKLNLGARRLSCQTQILGDLIIDVPAESQVHKQVVRKEATERNIHNDPSIRLYFVTVREPDMHDPSGDYERLLQALEREWQLRNLQIDHLILPQLQNLLRQGNWEVTVAVHMDQTIIALWPEYHYLAYGLAVDVGSTTIAAHLCQLDNGQVVASNGVMNPQIRFGEDLMSRVSYVMMNPGGEQELTQALCEALNHLIREITAEVDALPQDILSLTLVGNPVMHHLLLGLNPVELGGAPFALALDSALEAPARELGLVAHPGARAYVLPCIAGHVGADTAAVVLSERPDLEDPVTLLVDVGTNAEIVLGNRHQLLACSSPTGPAFEGAQISGGQRAAPGAIERVRIDPETLEPRFRVIGSELWSHEPGFAESIASTGITGICGSGIIEVVAQMYLAGIIDSEGVVDGAFTQRNSRIFQDGRTFSYLLHNGDVIIVITQSDIRQIQLAKAALYAGVRLLMDQMGVEQVDQIRLAGAFGSHIDVTYAMVLGLIPDCAQSAVCSVGNAAGTGARIALLNRQSRTDIEHLVRKIVKVETAVEPRFQEHFVEAMAIPHKTAEFPRLAQAITLPEAKQSQPAAGRGRGRRRSK